ncbi:uncharacterized protein LOC117559805 [Gymnodraco acuticeps]|uniref:Uncharacterized protein LOC117559805 n=1 Tax=Gymnodraco acuticeps TaxID=8218 RepID=A0A6P8VNX1_GYMAC|nr:uncharacterized protein LOC117559805 [Gymnodraco acuticeps]
MHTQFLISVYFPSSFLEPQLIPSSYNLIKNLAAVNITVKRLAFVTALLSAILQDSFFAIRINIHSVSVNVNLLKTWLAGLARMCLSMSASECQDIFRALPGKHAHLECHGTEQRLYSCMVILEMSGPVNGCFLKKLLKQIIDRDNYITNEKPLTRMVVCGPPGLAVRTLLGSNLTWVESDLLMSDVCQPDPHFCLNVRERRALLYF